MEKSTTLNYFNTLIEKETQIPILYLYVFSNKINQWIVSETLGVGMSSYKTTKIMIEGQDHALNLGKTKP